ncbi:site-specific DNA-methyltransferase [Armatimonadetes bacterium Uphvl-Ar1]|nr:site-specific DNA-methyltransferase [Armatimonadetes bacterium Uphvl-Ar1]
MSKSKQPKPMKVVESIKHYDASRKNIPTAEYQSVMNKEDQEAIRIAYERRNRDLDPQLVWRGKDEQDWSDLVVHAPPLYIQEKVHPQALIKDLMKETQAHEPAKPVQLDFFSDFNGIPKDADKTDFYVHDSNWSNRMILGDSLQVMASLAEREGLRGQVQCIYLDPPYGIKFNSNFQWSTTSREVKDGKREHITREPEMVKAFRDTWRDGIHTYLTYLRDRLIVSRDLLAESGSIFVQIGDENVHRVRALMDEVFGEDNFVSQISFIKTTSATSAFLPTTADIILWFSRSKNHLKYRQPFQQKELGGSGTSQYVWARTKNLTDIRIAGKTPEDNMRVFAASDMKGQSGGASTQFLVELDGAEFHYGKGGWKTNAVGMLRARKADRLKGIGKSLMYRRYFSDFAVFSITNQWDDVLSTGFSDERYYVVQTGAKVIQRCILMASDPGDLVLDPTCGSGTMAYVAEQWGRRWITIDTSRVALALARSRIMGARYPYYLLTDSPEGQQKEAQIALSEPSIKETFGNIRHGFVYDRVPHITLKSIANNTEIDVIWEDFQTRLEPLREKLNELLAQSWEEWEIPRDPHPDWNDEIKQVHAEWWELRIARQKEIDASIASKADSEFLYDKPFEDKKKVRVAGPFTVESLSPFRTLVVDENDELVDAATADPATKNERDNFATMILDNLKSAGVQQAHKEDKIGFDSVIPWPGRYICGEAHYREGEHQKRAGIFIGPEFGTVSRQDLVEAAREAGDADFDVLISCAFNYDAPSSEFDKLGRIPILKARMNADLHMGSELKNTGKGNLFVIFGEPDIDIMHESGQIQVKINGVDVFDPTTGEVRSDNADGIACWFIDTDYNGESFFVRHAYFLGANDPYKSLKTTLKAEIDAEAWETLNSDESRPFNKPTSGRIAVKVINHLGDEVMKVFEVL